MLPLPSFRPDDRIVVVVVIIVDVPYYRRAPRPILPATQVLFMIGTNDRGEEVRGRFTFGYNNDCDVDAYGVMDGDVYAWNE